MRVETSMAELLLVGMVLKFRISYVNILDKITFETSVSAHPNFNARFLKVVLYTDWDVWPDLSDGLEKVTYCRKHTRFFAIV